MTVLLEADEFPSGPLERKSLSLYQDYPFLKMLFPPSTEFLSRVIVPKLEGAVFKKKEVEVGKNNIMWTYPHKRVGLLKVFLDREGRPYGLYDVEINPVRLVAEFDNGGGMKDLVYSDSPNHLYFHSRDSISRYYLEGLSVNSLSDIHFRGISSGAHIRRWLATILNRRRPEEKYTYKGGTNRRDYVSNKGNNTLIVEKIGDNITLRISMVNNIINATLYNNCGAVLVKVHSTPVGYDNTKRKMMEYLNNKKIINSNDLGANLVIVYNPETNKYERSGGADRYKATHILPVSEYKPEADPFLLI